MLYFDGFLSASTLTKHSQVSNMTILGGENVIKIKDYLSYF